MLESACWSPGWNCTTLLTYLGWAQAGCFKQHLCQLQQQEEHAAKGVPLQQHVGQHCDVCDQAPEQLQQLLGMQLGRVAGLTAVLQHPVWWRQLLLLALASQRPCHSMMLCLPAHSSQAVSQSGRQQCVLCGTKATS